jgi:hypothetical protein
MLSLATITSRSWLIMPSDNNAGISESESGQGHMIYVNDGDDYGGGKIRGIPESKCRGDSEERG